MEWVQKHFLNGKEMNEWKTKKRKKKKKRERGKKERKRKNYWKKKKNKGELWENLLHLKLQLQLCFKMNLLLQIVVLLVVLELERKVKKKKRDVHVCLNFHDACLFLKFKRLVSFLENWLMFNQKVRNNGKLKI